MYSFGTLGKGSEGLTKDCRILIILRLWVVPHHRPKVVIIDRLLVLHHEVPPPLLPRLALHLILVDRLGGVELREGLLQVSVDFLVNFGEAEGRAFDFLENGPVGLHVLNYFYGELLFDLERRESAVVPWGEGSAAHTSSLLSASAALKFLGMGPPAEDMLSMGSMMGGIAVFSGEICMCSWVTVACRGRSCCTLSWLSSFVMLDSGRKIVEGTWGKDLMEGLRMTSLQPRPVLVITVATE